MTDLGVEDRPLFCAHCHAAYRRDDLQACPLDGAELRREETDPLLGMTVNEQYTITDCIAYGATSRVYRAHHTRLWRRELAVKVLLGDLIAEQATRMRFAQEAELLSRLDHPNVVSVVDFARTPEGLLYLVMDLAHGPTLAEMIGKHGAIPWRRAVALSQQMCRGLQHAHEQGIVHRDFKPDNVIIERASGEELARIIDFGIALPPADDSAPRLTSTGISLGTPAYASPEQAFNITLDHRIDLFALGVTMYEMLAGSLPFSGDAHELLQHNAFQEPPRFAIRNPAVAVPQAIERVVRRLMAKRPEDRFQTAADVAAALDDALAELPITVSAQRAAAITPRRLHNGPTESLTQLAIRQPPKELPIWIKAAGGVAVLGTAAVLLIGQLRSSPRPPIVVEPASAPATAVEPASNDGAQLAQADVAVAANGSGQPAVRAAAAAPMKDATVAGRAVRPRAAPIAAVPAAARFAPSTNAGGETRLILRPGDLDAHAAADSAAAAAESTNEPAIAEAAKVGSPEAAPAVVATTAETAPSTAPSTAPATTAPAASEAAPSSTAAAAAVPPASVEPAPAAAKAPPAPAPAPAPAPMALTSSELQVTGSLSPRTVERAVARIKTSISQCAPLATGKRATVRFVINERSRASSVTVEGGGDPLAGCLRTALTALRTESPPDVGNVDAVLTLSFAPKAP